MRELDQITMKSQEQNYFDTGSKYSYQACDEQFQNHVQAEPDGQAQKHKKTN